MKGYKFCFGELPKVEKENGKWKLKNTNPFMCLVELEIPEDATVVSQETQTLPSSLASVEKHRTNKATVTKIHGGFKEAFSAWDEEFKYVEGKEVVPTLPFDPDENKPCSSGIHFFKTKEEVLNWMKAMGWSIYGELAIDKEEKEKDNV